MTGSTRVFVITFSAVLLFIFGLMVYAIVMAFVNGFVKEATLSSIMVGSVLAIGTFLFVLVKDATKR